MFVDVERRGRTGFRGRWGMMYVRSLLPLSGETSPFFRGWVLGSGSGTRSLIGSYTGSPAKYPQDWH
jgi:hypothetical protein